MIEVGPTIDSLLSAAIGNAVLVSTLALMVEVVVRLVRQPAIGHRLWLLLLVKLIAPPILVVSMDLPRRLPSGRAPKDLQPANGRPPGPPARGAITQVDGGAPASKGDTPARSASPASRAADLIETAAARVSLEWGSVLGVVWLAGTGLWALRYAVQFARIRRWLDRASAAPEVEEMAAEVARSVGLGRPPVVRFVSSALSPAVWALGRRATLVIPEGLWGRLGEVQRVALLTHELAHLRRRDHWVRPLELVVTALYWWFPVVWWIRRSLHEAEERCCDAWVLRALPDSRRSYAQTLLDTIDFLAEGPLRLPVLATGMSDVALLKSRLAGIMRGTAAPSLSRRGTVGLLGLGSVLLPLSLPRGHGATRYHLTDLGTLGGQNTTARAINDRGEVVGWSEDPSGVQRAFRTRPGRPIDPAAGEIRMTGFDSKAVAINNRGQVLVLNTLRPLREEGRWNPFAHRWDSRGAMRESYRVDGDQITPLGSLDGRSFPRREDLKRAHLQGLRSAGSTEADLGWFATCVDATALNDDGVAVGRVIDNHECVAGFRTAPDRAVDPDRDDFGDTGSRQPRSGIKLVSPVAVNNRGQVVGITLGPDGKEHAFRSRPGRPVDLSFDELSPGADACYPTSINDRGQVAGSVYVGDSDSGRVLRAFLGRPDRPIDPVRDDLGTLGGDESRATAINDRGEVVGSSRIIDRIAETHAFLFDGRKMIDLNDVVPPGSGLTLTAATGINNRGQIVGEAKMSGNMWYLRGFLLTPLPETTPWIILGIASAVAVTAGLRGRMITANHIGIL